MTIGSGLEMPESGSCAFCEYLSGRRPYTILWRESSTAVLVTREQRGIAHLLVMPTRHAGSLLDIRNEEAKSLMLALRDAAIAIDLAMDRPGIAIWQNNGTPAHQTIGHVHFHIAGTLPSGGTDFGDVPELSLQETDEIASQLVGFVPEGLDARDLFA